MGLYRARPEDGVAWVTGASSGIGRQLSLDLAREGYTVAATARGEEDLASLAAEASGLKGRILPYPADVTDDVAVDRALSAVESDLGPVALAVFCAGNFYPTRGERLDIQNFVATYKVNVLGVVNGLVPLVERMKQRGAGQLAIVASVTGYAGIPLSAAYGGTKAALNNMAEALKFDFDKMNIRIQIINPGFIDTPLTKKNKFPMPALMPVDKASERIVEGLKSGGFEITFPRRLTWALKAVNLLPHRAYFAIMNRAMGWKKRPLGR